MYTDPIADYLTRIRNASLTGHKVVEIPSSKMKNELGWVPKESFESGLEKTVNWFLNNSWWWEPIYKAKKNK